MLETLDEFQDIKYTEAEKWKEIKETYKEANWQKTALQNLKT